MSATPLQFSTGGLMNAWSEPSECRPRRRDHLNSSHVLPALARVGEVYRPTVALFYLEDRSYKEIAAILEVPIGTVRSRIARGRAQLRGRMSPDRRAPGGDYSEWDLSSTLIVEPFGEC